MKTRLILLTLAIVLIAQAGVNGQVTNFLKKKIEKAAGEDTLKVSKPRVNPLAGLFSGGDEVEHKDSYDFTFMIVMDMLVKEIDNNANQTFSLQGYTIMNMGNR